MEYCSFTTLVPLNGDLQAWQQSSHVEYCEYTRLVGLAARQQENILDSSPSQEFSSPSGQGHNERITQVFKRKEEENLVSLYEK